MYYENIPEIPFSFNGKIVPLKDLREYEEYPIKVLLKISPKDELDEIASRKEIYGDEGEMNTYRIIEANITQLFEGHFSLNNIPVIKVPI